MAYLKVLKLVILNHGTHDQGCVGALGGLSDRFPRVVLSKVGGDEEVECRAQANEIRKDELRCGSHQHISRQHALLSASLPLSFIPYPQIQSAWSGERGMHPPGLCCWSGCVVGPRSQPQQKGMGARGRDSGVLHVGPSSIMPVVFLVSTNYKLTVSGKQTHHSELPAASRQRWESW
jgi:hypothetical protein